MTFSITIFLNVVMLTVVMLIVVAFPNVKIAKLFSLFVHDVVPKIS